MIRNDMKREFQVPNHNPLIVGAYQLIAQLMKDPTFAIADPMTDAYLQEVGYEIGWRPETTMRIVEFMYDKNLLYKL
jgi:hypothetical protein